MSRRWQGALGTLAATLVLAGTVYGVKDIKDSQRAEAVAKQEQKEYDRFESLRAKYNVDLLSQDSQDAFWRLALLSASDIIAIRSVYFDDQQAGEWLQEDIVTLNNELVSNGQTTNEYDLAREVIPAASREMMRAAGFEFMPIEAVPCDVDPNPTFRPFDYSYHSPEDFTVTVQQLNGKNFVYIPLGARQKPLPPETFSSTRPLLSFSPQGNFGAYRIINRSYDPNPPEYSLYHLAGCEVLPRDEDEVTTKQLSP